MHDLLWRGIAVIYASDAEAADRVALLIRERTPAYSYPQRALEKIWGCFDAYVFIMAMGGLTRILCKRIREKWLDPPVLAITHDLSAVIPVLGHHRGADEIADWLATLLRAKAIHTTMSRHLGFSPVEEVERRMLCKLSREDVLEIYKSLVRGKRVCLEDPPPGIRGYYREDCDIIIKRGCNERFCCRPFRLYVGFGAKSNATVMEVVQAIREVMRKIGTESIEAVASVRPMVNEVAELLGTRAMKLTVDQLMPSRCLSPAPRAAPISIAEAAAIAAAGPTGELLYRKISFFRKVTVAVAHI